MGVMFSLTSTSGSGSGMTVADQVLENVETSQLSLFSEDSVVKVTVSITDNTGELLVSNL